MLEGRACPANVYIDDSNKTTTTNCLYYTTAFAPQTLNAAGTSQVYTGWGQIGIGGYGSYATMYWYVGNIQTCATLGMRIPTFFETTAPNPADGNQPVDASPTFNTSKGIPSASGGYTWTATGEKYAAGGMSFATWYANTAGSEYYNSTPHYVRCVVP